MANAVAVQAKVVDLKTYLEKPEVKGKLASALPKWLSVDRLLRVIHSSVMKNPKLAECSTTSILQCAMDLAQLGIEPILGRAYLVPYQNSKNINGQWVKVYECQMQIGYQGLIDLARRSDTISDVWGAVVYENDDFHLSFGMDRDLRHTPWYMDPEKRKTGEPGEVVGAYVVWQLKDGTKHPDFMPIYEIHKRRALSQAYTWAETGDPGRGGGKRDSVWHKWEEEMILKTVIKHSSKLVPASIEFMQAVEVDDESSNGHGATLGGGFALPEPETPLLSFNELLSQKIVPNNGSVEKFLDMTAKAQRMTVENLKMEAEKEFDSFWGAFEDWYKKQQDYPDQVLLEEIRKARPASGKGAAENYRSLILGKIAVLKELPEVARNNARAKWDGANLGPWPLDPPQVEKDPDVVVSERSTADFVDCPREMAGVGITECQECKDAGQCQPYQEYVYEHDTGMK